MEDCLFDFFGDMKHSGFELFHNVAFDQERNIGRCCFFLNYLLDPGLDSSFLFSGQQFHAHDFDLDLLVPRGHFPGNRYNHSCIDVRIRPLPCALKSRTGNKASFITNSENSRPTGLFYLDNFSFDPDKPAFHAGIYFR